METYETYKIPKISAEERCGRVRNLTKHHSQKTIKATIILKDASQKKVRFANAVSQTGRIEAAVKNIPLTISNKTSLSLDLSGPWDNGS